MTRSFLNNFSYYSLQATGNAEVCVSDRMQNTCKTKFQFQNKNINFDQGLAVDRQGVTAETSILGGWKDFFMGGRFVTGTGGYDPSYIVAGGYRAGGTQLALAVEDGRRCTASLVGSIGRLAGCLQASCTTGSGGGRAAGAAFQKFVDRTKM